MVNCIRGQVVADALSTIDERRSKSPLRVLDASSSPSMMTKREWS